MKHFGIVGVLVVISTVLISIGLKALGLLPLQASAQAIIIDGLFDQHIYVVAFLFSLILVFLGYSFVVFRRKPGETGDGDHFEGHTGLEIAWTVLPLGVVLYFSYMGATTLADVRRVDPQAMTVRVVASQWAWRFEYPDYEITSTELHLPVNQQVRLELVSADVIHSFWVPEFRVKQDALPGEANIKELVVTPNQTGEFKVRCAELCGTRHAYMEQPVVVEDEATFQAWIKMMTPPDTAQGRGELAAKNFGCIACHSLDGTAVVGPTWKGLFGKEETLTDGTKVLVDEAYLHQSIVDPNAQIVQGFAPNIMPATFGETLEEAQIQDIIAYIKTIK